MATHTKPPRRLRIKEFTSIDGLREGRRLYSGLYELGRNMSEDEAIRLASDEFSHCVEILGDEREPEELAEDAPIPEASAADKYIRAKRKEAEEKFKERWPVPPIQHTSTR